MSNIQNVKDTPKQDKATARPWYVNRLNDQIGDIWSEAADMPVAQAQPCGTLKRPDNEQRNANAELIVRAVNEHAALTAVASAAEAAEQLLQMNGLRSTSLRHALSTLAAIRK